jgi:tRNA modification GTPase
MQDTIIALATPRGNSPRAILRLSGPQAMECVLERFIPELTPGSLSEMGHRYASLKGNILVEENTYSPCLLYIMRAPHSYTREDVVEVHTLGSPPLIEMLLEGLLSSARKSGRAVRLAEAGEFTKRAFLNGRIDLLQVEAVLRLIRSRSDAELRLAARAALGGEGSRSLKEAQECLAELLCQLELSLDFSDQDIEPLPQEVFRGRLAALCKDLYCHQRGAEGVKRNGVRAVFYGPPNVGKSSLFNLLLGGSRAITSPHPGTTRDTLEAELTIGGVSFCLVDTAGLRQARDLEAMAVARTRDTVKTSDMALLVLDGTSPHGGACGLYRGGSASGGCPPLNNLSEPFCVEDNQAAILVINKSDLPQSFSHEALPSALQGLPVVYTSAVTGAGLERLRQAMMERVLSGEVDSSPSLLSSRQRLLLEETAQALERALECTNKSAPQELVALELREALNKLGEVCGTITSEDILGRIFSQFCIGK